MQQVTDADENVWQIRRWWWTTVPWRTYVDILDTIIFLLVLPFMLMWPFWLAAKWLGVPWTVLIERNGERVGRERVKGWRRSGERIAELARLAEAGTLFGELGLDEA